MSREELTHNIERWTIGLDDAFQFHCTQCGKCCVDREDILLSPRDMYHIARYLKLSPADVLKTYCETYIGEVSRVPIIRLKPIGKTRRCPFLKNRKCIIHDAKPSVCAIYPLGRYVTYSAISGEIESCGGQTVRYLLQPVACGDTNETHTVRDWLKDFDFETEDKAHILWTSLISKTGRFVKLAEENIGFERLVPVWNAVLVIAYLSYDTEQDFFVQFEENASSLELLFEKLSKVFEDNPDNGQATVSPQ